MRTGDHIPSRQADSQQFLEPQDGHLNLYEDLRTRLQGTVTVLGEIVKSDPELWSDDR
jgi:hypothetical protein